LLSSFPFDQLLNAIIAGESSLADSIKASVSIFRILKFVKFVKVIRLLRVAKLKIILIKLIDYLNLDDAVLTFMSFFKLTLLLVIIAHWLGCFFHYIGNNSGDTCWINRFGL